MTLHLNQRQGHIPQVQGFSPRRPGVRDQLQKVDACTIQDEETLFLVLADNVIQFRDGYCALWDGVQDSLKKVLFSGAPDGFHVHSEHKIIFAGKFLTCFLRFEKFSLKYTTKGQDIPIDSILHKPIF